MNVDKFREYPTLHLDTNVNKGHAF